MTYPIKKLGEICLGVEVFHHRTLCSGFSEPFYFTQEFWTAAATIVAIFMPLFVIWLSNRPKKSLLKVRGVSVVNQDTAEDEVERNTNRLLDVGRLVIKNEGKNIAKSVEAYIEQIDFDGEVRKNFIPVPLVWTHGQLNKTGPILRDIYPNQTAHLDIFNHVYNSDYIGDSSVLFAVAAGLEVEDFSKMNLGASEITIRLYQESGQVDTIRIKAIWDGRTVPTISVI